MATHTSVAEDRAMDRATCIGATVDDLLETIRRLDRVITEYQAALHTANMRLRAAGLDDVVI